MISLNKAELQIIVDLAEGKLQQDAWLAWWDAHAQHLEDILSKGAFLKLKPRCRDENNSRAILSSQLGAWDLLDKLAIPYQRSERYQQQWQAEFAEYSQKQQALASEKQKRFSPIINHLKPNFPQFSKLLKRKFEDINALQAAASAVEIQAVENRLGITLPITLRDFFMCCQSVSMEGFTLQLDGMFIHPTTIDGQTALCIGDYWLEADGDQLLIISTSQQQNDCAVYYYAHAQQGSVKYLDSSFKHWLETLARSTLFEE